MLVAAGLDVPWLEEVLAAVGPRYLEGAVRWLAYTVETETLMNEIEDSATRISTLVGAAKQYSQIDRAPYQIVDLRELLKSTLVMMSPQARRGITVVKDFDRSCRRSRRTPPSSTRCGPTSSTTRSARWADRAR